MGKARQLAAGIGLAALLTGCLTTSSKPPLTWDGLEYRPTRGIDALYVSPEGTSKAYRTVMIDPPVFALDRNWHPFDPGITPWSGRRSDAEIADIKSTVSSAFVRIFAEALAAGGYQPVEQASADTLRVSPGLANVYLNTPPGTMNTWKKYEGRLTLVMELRDGSTGRLVARLVDEEVGDMGMLESPNTVLNSPDFRRTVQAWAQAVRVCLDEANGKPPQQRVPSQRRGLYGWQSAKPGAPIVAGSSAGLFVRR